MHGNSRQEKPRRSGSSTLRVPIAIIGGACRFTGGVDSLDALWAALLDGRDLMDYARDRSDGADTVGRLDGPFCFDPAAFQITPREAAEMDPQQQIFLQVTQEAFADAGYTRERLKGSRTGVVAGVYANDYLLMRAARPETIDTHTAAGVSHAVIANRVSYVYDLAAPSFAVDSACSSGLLAVHLAVRMLRAGDADACLAGAVNLIPNPLSQLITGRVLTMAADGRCKAFDASADGIVRSEGCGALVLKRLDDALAEGDPIRAVILGTASNQDGRTNGLSAPSGTAQQAVIRAALADGGLQPDVVDFIEAHGTGTPLGDPVEISALGAVYGQSLHRSPVVGAVKANLGHAEAVSGIAGLMKAMMVVEHRQVPPQLHLRTVNAAVEEARKNLHLGTAACALDTPNEVAHAGVSSFGFSGTNVHVVLRAAFAEEVTPVEEPHPVGLALVVSAPTPEALLQHQSDFAELLARCSSDAEVEQVCRAAATRRDAQPYRIATTADSARALIAEASRPRPLAAATTGAPLVAFLFTGQAAQSTSMAAGLMQRDDEFRARIHELDAMFVKAGDPLGPFARMASLPDGLALPTDIAQGTNFCLQIALAEWLLRANLQPAVVAGHSVGEVAAACVAGLLSIEDGIEVIRARARLMRRVEGAGRTIVVRGPFQSFLDASANLANVDLAAENSPYSIAVACSAPDAPEVERIAAVTGCSTAVLPTSVAFHSRIMDPLLREMRNDLANLRPGIPRLDMISSVDPLAVPEADADYWARGLRQTVRFRGALETMLEMGMEAFVEVGPHPTLTVFAEETAQHSRQKVITVSSLNHRTANGETLLAALGRLWECGVPVNWATVLGRPTGRQPLPRCPGSGAAVHQGRAGPYGGGGPDNALTAHVAELVPVSDESPLEDRVAQHVGAVMKESGHIKREIALQALGFDSLMAVELKKRLEAAFAISLPARILLGSPTVRDVALAVETSLDESHLDQLSDAEVERLLVRMQDGNP